VIAQTIPQHRRPASRSGVLLCTTRGCDAPATATVPGYPDPLAKCFTHEREYVDRYGYGEVRALA
jgi:hypothetical protein